MAGPIVMALGPFAFEALGFSFVERRRGQITRWAEIPVAGGMNPSQWTGGDAQVETITGVLFPARLGGQSNLDGLRAAAALGAVLPLITRGLVGGSNVFGAGWLIENVDAKTTWSIFCAARNTAMSRDLSNVCWRPTPAWPPRRFRSMPGARW